MTRNENAASTSPICWRGTAYETAGGKGKVKENICQTSRRLMAFLMAENQVCFYVPRDRIGTWSCATDCVCGNLAVDIKGRSCCKWLVLWQNESAARPPSATSGAGYEKSLVIIDACENSLESHTCPPSPESTGHKLCHFLRIACRTNIDICSCEKSCPKNFDPPPGPKLLPTYWKSLRHTCDARPSALRERKTGTPSTAVAPALCVYNLCLSIRIYLQPPRPESG